MNAGLSFTHNDILADGLKLSGCEQYHHDGVLLHHGTLLFDSELGIIPRVLKSSGKVTNTEEFMRTLVGNIRAQKTPPFP